MSKTDVMEKFKGKLLEQVKDYCDAWYEKHDIMYFHGPLAAVIMFDETICEYQQGMVKVEIYDKEKLGTTRFDPDAKEKPHTVAVNVDVDRFFERYFKIAQD